MIGESHAVDGHGVIPGTEWVRALRASDRRLR
jgi:hypothetical protein